MGRTYFYTVAPWFLLAAGGEFTQPCLPYHNYVAANLTYPSLNRELFSHATITKTSSLLLQEHKVKISYMPFMVKAASMALREHPILNASIDPEAEMVTYRANHNIGVAMDTPGGLLVPSIKRVQARS